MGNQKFKKHDHVMIAKYLGPHMSHFQSGCEAIVVGSYADQYGGENTSSYTLYIKGSGEVSWYHEDQFSLIASERKDLLDGWEKERQTEITLKSDLDWIFENGVEVAESPCEASIKALAECLGITNLWGSNGEGFVWASNALYIISRATPFLVCGDKDGWLKACEDIRG